MDDKLGESLTGVPSRPPPDSPMRGGDRSRIHQSAHQTFLELPPDLSAALSSLVTLYDERNLDVDMFSPPGTYTAMVKAMDTVKRFMGDNPCAH